MGSKETRGLVRGLGLASTTALVAGNVIGSGIYVIPASLAAVAGPVSLLAWGIVAAGNLCMTAVYADIASAYPVSGGLQVYAQRAFGNFVGLETAFLYWISQVIGNAAYLTAFVGYSQVFFPRFAEPVAAFLLAQALLWTLTLVNILGVRAGGAVQVVTTVLKVVPLLVVAVALLASGSTSNLVPFAPKGYAALFPAISLVAWIFLGAESVTVPAEEVRDPERTIRKSAYAGFALATVVYFLVALAVTLGLPSAEIAGSPSPLATAALRVLGPWGRTFVTLGALVSLLGVLNGWLLVTGRLPFAAARQGLAPAWLGRIAARTRTPAVSLAFSSLLTSALVLLYFNRTLLEAYNVIALASTATALLAIGVACAAQLVLLRREPERFGARERRRAPFTAVASLFMVGLMIAGSGLEVGLYTLLAVVLPAPYYLWLRTQAGDHTRGNGR